MKKFLINTISVDYLDPFNFRRYNLIHHSYVYYATNALCDCNAWSFV